MHYDSNYNYFYACIVVIMVSVHNTTDHNYACHYSAAIIPSVIIPHGHNFALS